MDKFRDDLANALISHRPGLARWIEAALPGTFVDSAPWNRDGSANDPTEGITTQLACVAEAIRFDEPQLFLQSVAWVESRRREGDASIEQYLETLQKAAEHCLPDQFSDIITPLFEKAFAAFIQPNSFVPSPFRKEALFGDVTNECLELLLAQKTREARKFVLDSVDRGLRPVDLFDFVFTPALRQIGWLWQTRKIDEAQEHFCATFIQSLMTVVSAECASSGVPRSVAGFCAGGELHDVGIRMLCESLFVLGWESTTYGANLPTDNVVAIVQQRQPDLVAISATMIGNLHNVQAAVAAIRAANLRNQPKIFVGGMPFELCPSLVAKVRADGSATSCSDLISQVA